MITIHVDILGSAEVSRALEPYDVEIVYCNPNHYCVFKGEKWETEPRHWVLPIEIIAETMEGEYVHVKESRRSSEGDT